MPSWLRHVRRVVVLVGVAAVMSATAPAAEPPAVRIAPGVAVGHVKVGGLTSEPARRLLRHHYAQPLHFAGGKERWRLAPERFSSAAVDDALSEALHAPARTKVRLRVRVRGRAVVHYVGSLARRFYRKPQDAELAGLTADLRPSFTPARPGRRVVREPVVEAIWRALKTGRREEIVLPTAPVKPKVTPATYGPVIVIRRASNRLTLYSGPRTVGTFGVATGQSQYPTPLGTWSIVDMQRDPWWRPPDSAWAQGLDPIPPGPGNPLGTRWMGLSAAGVGIHGTPDAASIGYSASHGCIRMRIPDAEYLFTQVHIGTPVVIVDA
jgi:lipoprotein-anchoring transpeptidase ErfK/SrfK